MTIAACNADQLPLLKLLFHAAKFPHAAINGLLLGSVSSDGTVVTIIDAVPLFHASMELAAPTEIALATVEAYTQQQPDRPRIVGYYHSDARYQAADMSPLSRRLADRIADRKPPAVVVLLDNKKLGSFLQEGLEASGQAGGGHPFELFCHDGKGWKREAPTKLTVAGPQGAMREKFLSMVAVQAHRALHDFDEHLDDLGKCWLNADLAESIGLAPAAAAAGTGQKQRPAAGSKTGGS